MRLLFNLEENLSFTRTAIPSGITFNHHGSCVLIGTHVLNASRPLTITICKYLLNKPEIFSPFEVGPKTLVDATLVYPCVRDV